MHLERGRTRSMNALCMDKCYIVSYFIRSIFAFSTIFLVHQKPDFQLLVWFNRKWHFYRSPMQISQDTSITTNCCMLNSTCNGKLCFAPLSGHVGPIACIEDRFCARAAKAVCSLGETGACMGAQSHHLSHRSHSGKSHIDLHQYAPPNLGPIPIEERLHALQGCLHSTHFPMLEIASGLENLLQKAVAAVSRGYSHCY